LSRFSHQIQFGRILRKSVGFFLSAFSNFISGSNDIILVELSPIYHGLIIGKDLCFVELVCYYDYLVCINLINDCLEMYHVYVILIQDIKKLLHQSNVTVCHTLVDGNRCADFWAKLEASLNVNLLIHASPTTGLLSLLRSDTNETFCLRE